MVQLSYTVREIKDYISTYTSKTKMKPPTSYPTLLTKEKIERSRINPYSDIKSNAYIPRVLGTKKLTDGIFEEIQDQTLICVTEKISV